MHDLLAAGRFEVTRGDVTWVVDRARLVDVRVAGSTAGALPAAAARPAGSRAPAAARAGRRGPHAAPATALTAPDCVGAPWSASTASRSVDGTVAVAAGMATPRRDSASAGSHSRATDGPLPDSQPHQAPASSPLARAVRDDGEAANRSVLVQPIGGRPLQGVDVAGGKRGDQQCGAADVEHGVARATPSRSAPPGSAASRWRSPAPTRRLRARTRAAPARRVRPPSPRSRRGATRRRCRRAPRARSPAPARPVAAASRASASVERWAAAATQPADAHRPAEAEAPAHRDR